MKFRILSVVTSMFLAGSAATAPLNLVCDLKSKGTAGSGSFLSSPVVILVNDSQNAANILDGLILAVKGKALPGRVRKTAKGVRVNWRVDQIPSLGGRYASVSYTATIDTKTNHIVMRGRILNAENNINGVGACRELTQAEIKKGNFLKR